MIIGRKYRVKHVACSVVLLSVLMAYSYHKDSESIIKEERFTLNNFTHSPEEITLGEIENTFKLNEGCIDDFIKGSGFADDGHDQPIGNDKEVKESDSSCFFFRNTSDVAYKARFGFIQPIDLLEAVNLSITELQKFEAGTLYELKIDCKEDFPGRMYYDWDRFHLGYFYVQGDKIFLLRGDNILATINTPEDIISKGKLVCQDDEQKDEENEGTMFHQWITVEGNKREYHSYNAGTETGFYENFVWEAGVGLVSYRSGFGAEKEGIELTIVNEVQNN